MRGYDAGGFHSVDPANPFLRDGLMKGGGPGFGYMPQPVPAQHPHHHQHHHQQQQQQQQQQHHQQQHLQQQMHQQQPSSIPIGSYGGPVPASPPPASLEVPGFPSQQQASPSSNSMPEDKSKYPCNVTQYKLCGIIGEGSNGTVYKAWCRPLEQYVAIKVINLDTKDFDLKNFGYEMSTMALCQHKNILEFKRAFVYREQLWVVLPYVRYGSLADIIKADHPNGFDDEPFVTYILRETLEGLNYLHTKCKQVHRDVKAANLLLTDEGHVKICDFGVVSTVQPTQPLAEVLDKKEKATQRQVGGSPCWMAPEVIAEFLRQGADQATLSQFGLNSTPATGTPVSPYSTTSTAAGGSTTPPFQPPSPSGPAPPAQHYQQAYPYGVPGHHTHSPYNAGVSGAPPGVHPGVPYQQYGGVVGAYPGQPGYPMQQGQMHAAGGAPSAYPYQPTVTPQMARMGVGPQQQQQQGAAPAGVPFGTAGVPPVQSVPRSPSPTFTCEAAAPDVWSFGITVLEILLGKPPYHRHTPFKVFSLTLSSAPPTLKALNHKKFERFSKAMAAFVDFCLNKNVQKRPTVEMLLQHPVFTGIRQDQTLSSFDLKLSEIKAMKKKKKKKRLQKGEKDTARDAMDDDDETVAGDMPSMLDAELGTPSQLYPDVSFEPEWEFPDDEASSSSADVLPVCDPSRDDSHLTSSIPVGAELRTARSPEDALPSRPGAMSAPGWMPQIGSAPAAATTLPSSTDFGTLFTRRPSSDAKLPVASSLGNDRHELPEARDFQIPGSLNWVKRIDEEDDALPTPTAPPEDKEVAPREEPPAEPQHAIIKIAVCPACLREPHDGRRLECGHCVCLACLEQGYSFKTEMYTLLKATSGLAFGKPGDLIMCPQCSHPTHLRKGRKGIPLRDLPRGVIKTHICDHCEERASEVRCDQCQVTLCDTCSGELHKRGRFKNHKTVPLTEFYAAAEGNAAGGDDSPDPYDSTASTHTASTSVSRSARGPMGTNLSYIDDYRMSDEDLIASLEKRHQQLGQSLDVLQTQGSEDDTRAQQATRSIENWAREVREALGKHERVLLDRVQDKDSTRRTTVQRQRNLVGTLRGQIEVTLKSLTSHLEAVKHQPQDEPDPVTGLTPVQIFRATSLLATPCASDPQQWSFDFRPAGPVFPKVSTLASLSVSTTQLTWTVPPGPFTEISARAVVVLAAAVLSQTVLGSPSRYTKLRARPEGIPKDGYWRVRQVVVFSSAGAAVALEAGRVSASGSQEGNEPDALVSTGGCWSAPVESEDDSWIEYDCTDKEVATIVVRSYPNKDHCPEYITLEGLTEDGTYVTISKEEVVQKGTACWDCIISI